jgi:hypothetical protein
MYEHLSAAAFKLFKPLPVCDIHLQPMPPRLTVTSIGHVQFGAFVNAALTRMNLWSCLHLEGADF